MAATYETISDPYNSLLERQSADFGLSNLTDQSAGVLSSDGTTNAGAANAAGANVPGFIGSTPVSNPSDIATKSVASQSITDLIIDNTIQSRNFQPRKIGFKINGRTGEAEFNNTVFVSNVVVTTINATTGTIGGFNIGSDFIEDSLDSFGLASTSTGSNDVRFWSGSTFATRNSAPFRVYEDGTVAAANMTITGGSVSTSVLSGNIGSNLLNVADRGWTQTCVFTPFDTDTVSWTSGTFKASDGTTYNIGSGNTGNMVAKTFIYLDISVSTTAYQTTTTATSAVGAGKVIIGVAQNNTTEATFKTFGGGGEQNLDGTEIVAGSITANEIAASSITAGKLSVSQLAAITADMGNLTAGTITLPAGGHIKSGQVAYNTGTGFFLGNDLGTAKLSIGTTSGNGLTWDGTTLAVTGVIQGTSGFFGSSSSSISIDSTGLVINSLGKIRTAISGERIEMLRSATGGFTHAIQAFDSLENIKFRLAMGGGTPVMALFGDDVRTGMRISNNSVTYGVTPEFGIELYGLQDGLQITTGGSSARSTLAAIRLDIDSVYGSAIIIDRGADATGDDIVVYGKNKRTNILKIALNPFGGQWSAMNESRITNEGFPQFYPYYHCSDFDEFIPAGSTNLSSTVIAKAYWAGSGTNGLQELLQGTGEDNNSYVRLSTTTTSNSESAITSGRKIPFAQRCLETRFRLFSMTNTRIEVGFWYDATRWTGFFFDTALHATRIYVHASNGSNSVDQQTLYDFVTVQFMTLRLHTYPNVVYFYFDNTLIYTLSSGFIDPNPHHVRLSVNNKSSSENKIMYVDFVKMWANRDPIAPIS